MYKSGRPFDREPMYQGDIYSSFIRAIRFGGRTEMDVWRAIHDAESEMDA